jgi:hypothetical protein
MICAHNNGALFTAGTWGGLSNSSADNVQVRDAGGVLVDGVSFNSDAGHAPAFGTFAAVVDSEGHWEGIYEEWFAKLQNLKVFFMRVKARLMWAKMSFKTQLGAIGVV